MRVDKITKAQILLAVISWLALLQTAITHTYVIPCAVMSVCFVSYKLLCDYEAEIRRKKYLARKGVR